MIIRHLVYFLLITLLHLDANAQYRDRWVVSDLSRRPVLVEILGASTEVPRFLYHWTTIKNLNLWASKNTSTDLLPPLMSNQSFFHQIFQHTLNSKGALFLTSDMIAGIGSAFLYPEYFQRDQNQPEDTRILLRIELDSNRIRHFYEVQTQGPVGPKEMIEDLTRAAQVYLPLRTSKLVKHNFIDPSGSPAWKEWILFDRSIVKDVQTSANSEEIREQLKEKLQDLTDSGFSSIDMHYFGGLFESNDGLQKIIAAVNSALTLDEDELPKIFSSRNNWENRFKCVYPLRGK